MDGGDLRYGKLVVVDFSKYVENEGSVQIRMDDKFDSNKDFIEKISVISKTKMVCVHMTGRIVIKEMLDEENPQQYSSVRSFLADLRKMFRNCFTFNLKESEIYKHAKKLEDKLDKLLEVIKCRLLMRVSIVSDLGLGTKFRGRPVNR